MTFQQKIDAGLYYRDNQSKHIFQVTEIEPILENRDAAAPIITVRYLTKNGSEEISFSKLETDCTLLDASDEVLSALLPPQIKKFRLHWLGGSKNDIEGYSISDACNKAGLGGGSLSALDYYEEIKDNN